MERDLYSSDKKDIQGNNYKLGLFWTQPPLWGNNWKEITLWLNLHYQLEWKLDGNSWLFATAEVEGSGAASPDK